MKLVILITFLLLTYSCNKKNELAAKAFDKDYKPMNEAYEKARSTIEIFKESMHQDKQNRFLIKSPVAADGKVEHVWLEPVKYLEEEKSFEGVVANDFVEINSIKKGDTWKVTESSISDWAIINSENQIIKGGYTIKVIRENKATKEKFK